MLAVRLLKPLAALLRAASPTAALPLLALATRSHTLLVCARLHMAGAPIVAAAANVCLVALMARSIPKIDALIGGMPAGANGGRCAAELTR